MASGYIVSARERKTQPAPASPLYLYAATKLDDVLPTVLISPDGCIRKRENGYSIDEGAAFQRDQKEGASIGIPQVFLLPPGP